MAETVVATEEAYAAPAETPSVEEPARGADGTLQAPDIATAQTIARLEGEPVEAIGERTGASSTWALPDGTLSTGFAAGPIWIREGGDGTDAADWSAVDLTLETAADGSVRPKAHPADLVLAGGGVPADGALLTATGDAAESVRVEWAESLPVPRLEGPRAVYEQVELGIDLVVEATRTGFEQFYVLTDRPAAGVSPELSLEVRTEDLQATADADGGVSFTNAAAEVVGTTGTPLVWDAAVDGERLHPITEPWVSGEVSLPPRPGYEAGAVPTDALPAASGLEDAPTLPATPATPALPAEAAAAAAVEEIPDGAGQAISDAATEAKGSPALPLSESAAIVGPGDVDLALKTDAGFLHDADTQYPVVIDPGYGFEWGFDTFVQTGYGSDQSGSAELRLGTYDGGATVARSFLNYDLSGVRNRVILDAQLSLHEWHSFSCQARNWEVWNTDPTSPSTRINAQPNWWGRWATSGQTTGYGAGCDDGWVSADVKSLIQAWASGGATTVGIGLKAENESDSYGWKKFNAANAYANIPYLYVQTSEPPGRPTGLTTSNSHTDSAGGVWTTSTTPRLSATAHDLDGPSSLLFRVYENGDGEDLVWEQDRLDVPNGSVGSVDVPAGVLTERKTYTFVVIPHDYVQWGPENSGWAPAFTVDSLKPVVPAVTSTDYPNDGQWHKDINEPGNFDLALPGDPSLAGYDWGLNKAPDTRWTASGDTRLPITPTTNGRQELQIQAVDKAGNRSPVVKYRFNVGSAGLLSPVEGAQVVRRVRLTAAGDAKYTHVKFAWRRGPDAGAGQDIDLAALSRADGSSLPGTWSTLSALGDATWDAGATLGHVPGPVQVRAVMATDAAGTGAYPTPWVTVTVSPDAKNAATDTVGPGSVNLLTGDYSQSSTDVSEFGLSLERSASSRDPRSGFEPQAELLSVAQQSMSAVDGYTPVNVTRSRVTDRGHAGMDAMRLEPNAGSAASYVSAANVGMQAGRTYRVTGWIYVPDSTGLNPVLSEGLRIKAVAALPGGGYAQALTDKPTVTGAWQQLTVDFAAPATAGTPFIQVINGFDTGGKVVYFDDLSVREIWAPLGPQWSLGTADEVAGTAYTHISQPEPDLAVLHVTGGGEAWFTLGGAQKWWPEPGAESLTLTPTGNGQWRLTELDGTVSDFDRQGGSDAKLVSTSPPAAAGATRLLYETVNGRLRLARLIAPVEPGIDSTSAAGTACTGAVPAVGCEVMQLVYATSTTATAQSPGTYAERLSEVRLWSAPTATATATTAVAAVKYAYNEQGMLVEAWDPRISPALKTSYTYDTDGRVLTMRPPGELPWRFTYGIGGSRASVGAGDYVDRSSGRLRSVSRASLVPGSVDQTGPDTTSTVVYAVPLTRAAGGPHDLDADTIASWGQRTGPTDATAIFGPEDVPSVTTADATTPGPDGYKPATIHYLDSSGREVNTATPSGPDAPAGGFVDTAEYDSYGNVVRSLDATNRLLALGQLPTAAADLAALNLTGADTPTRATALSTLSSYGTDGLDLQRSRGPLVRLAVGNDPNNVQLVHDLSTYKYDEEKPDGAAYHLLTTQTDALLVAGSSPEQLVDVEVTENGYDPIDGTPRTGPSSGWTIGQPTKVTFDAGGANLSALIRYDGQGRAVESRGIGSSGSDASSNVAVYYTAGPHPQQPGCGDKPAYAGLPCMSYAAGAVTGHDPTRMAGQLPVKHVTAYNRYGSIASVTESATGPVGGATVTQSRTTVTEYDAADRVTSVLLTGSGTGTAAAPLAKTVNLYDPATGDVTVIEGRDPATNALVSTVKKTFDQLGRMTRYEDGSGGWTDSVFDRFGKPTEVTDSTGATTTFAYDRTQEPRGFLTSVTDSVAGTISADYGPDGQVTEQVMPGGVALRLGYDANRTPTVRTYLRTSDDAVISQSAALENSAGQMVTHTTPAASKRYSYDALGRLTDVQDSITGLTSCTWRKYAYSDRGNRTSLATAVSPSAACVDPANPNGTPVATAGYTYDSADRLVTESTVAAGAWVYDPLGRITTAPVRGSPGATVSNAYYANDRIASQEIAGVARQTWSLDAIGRFASYTNQAWAAGADGVPAWQEAVTKVNHYDSDSDSPAWIAEDASLPDDITRYVDGLDGNLAMETGKIGARVLQLIDLHGDVMTTLPIQDGQTTADWTALAHQTSDEFGNPTDLTTGAAVVSDGSAPGKDGRYGWLGGKQRSADALAGVVLMGVRLYDPATGRFWSRDPQPGGNSTAYDYCSGDPVNCTDLDGQWGFFSNLVKKIAKKVAKVAEVVAMVVPGPVGAAAAAISAGAYAVTGNRAKALEMTVGIALAAVGAGAALAVAKLGSVAVKAGRGLMATRRAGTEFKSTPALGNKAHALFTQKVVLGRGGSVGPRLPRQPGIRGGRPDGLNAAGRPMELKPHNRGAISKGRGQLARYERLMGAPRGSGELWTYRQTPFLKRIVFSRLR